MKLRSTLLAVFFILSIVAAQQNYCDLEDPEFLITFHPHLDAFWLNTDDQLKSLNFRPAGFLFNMNQRNSKTIFNSMYEALSENATRKYFVTQIVFLKDWYDYLPEQRKKMVKEFIINGQLQIANGGWVQNDQAVCYYDDILDQYTVGHNFLYSEFGNIVKIGWATDSFGHSHSQVALQAILGMEFQGIERVDDRYVNQRKEGPLLQFYWDPVSDSNGKSYPGVVTQVRHFLHEVNDLRSSNVALMKDDFSRIQKTLRDKFRKNKVFRFLGNDFEEFIPQQFRNLQTMMSQLNKKVGCPEYKYGNPNDYLNLIKEHWSINPIPTRKYDFIPNWDQDHYWVGYYTTDPQLKKICKDFSRLVNLYRKVLLKKIRANQYSYLVIQEQLQKADALLSVMQHHDGITATSKTHIERLFKERMREATKNLIFTLGNANKFQTEQLVCRLYQERNTCNIKKSSNELLVKVLHQGKKKKQRVQFIMPNSDTFYQITGTQSDIFCITAQATNLRSPENQKQCRIVFQLVVQPGVNKYLLKRVEKAAVQSRIVMMNQVNDNKVTAGALEIALSGNQIRYSYSQNQFMKFGYYRSKVGFQSRSTVAWDKYGTTINKSQAGRAGMYIMFNDGVLESLNLTYNSFYAGVSQRYIKVIISASPINIEITIDKSNPKLLDWTSNFRPTKDREQNDYFLRAESHVKNEQQFYHDSNGYLVAKRILNWRPDYEWIRKDGDKINSNTYPACSFVYMKNSQEKFVSFVDRAQGVSVYDGSFIFNIQRLAGDDYKGAGEGYMNVEEHMFSQKFGVVSVKDDIERIWQRKYDQPLIAFISQKVSDNVQLSTATLHDEFSYLKYNIFILNENQIVLRLHNLAEKEEIKIPKFTQNKFQIPQLGISLDYVDIKETFANGNLIKDRKKWVDSQVMFKPGNKDSSESLILDSLQIRSFRINFKNFIQDKQKEVSKVVPIYQAKKLHLSLKNLRKRCW